MVLSTARRSSPAATAASAIAARALSSPASAARHAAQKAAWLRLPSRCPATHAARRPGSRNCARRGRPRSARAGGCKEAADSGEVDDGRVWLPFPDDRVRPPADHAGRGKDVAAGAAEVQAVAGQACRCAARSPGNTGALPRSAWTRSRPGGEPGLRLWLARARRSRSDRGRCLRPGRRGRAGRSRLRRLPPAGAAMPLDVVGVGGRVVEAVRCSGFF